MGEGVTATNLAPMAHDLSLWNLFLQADWVVKLVMLGLLFASIWVWAIVFEKVTSVRRANRAADAFEEKFWSGGSLEELYRSEGERPNHPMAAVFGSGMREWQASAQASVGSAIALMGVKERADRAMGVTVGREMERMERWMVFLASVGSVAPFIGLFGTVWGIMNSFAAIAGNNNTNLAVVAPGIAEALFATAIGLFAAIPAVMAYNRFNVAIARIRQEGAAAVGDLAANLSRRANTRLRAAAE